MVSLFKSRGEPGAGPTAKSRAILFLIVLFVLIALIVGYILYKRHQGVTPGGAGLVRAPGIQSIPGVGQTTTEYVKIQEQQNIAQAQKAEAAGTSAVPTITRVSYFGPGEFQAPGQAAKPGCSPTELRQARLAGVSAEELRCKGCTLAELKAAGYSAGELANAGFSPTDLKNAGFSPADLKAAGFSAAELRRAGFSPQDLANAGYDAAQLSQAGFSPTDLQNAGLSPDALAAAGIGARPSANLPRDCSVNALRQARAQGVTAAQLRKMGCGAAALLAAGYTPAELKAAGFTPDELRAAGVGAKALKDAGFTAGELRRAGFSPTDLKNAGFSPQDLKNAGLSAADLRNAGFTPDQIKGAGYTAGDLVRAGISPDQISGAGANCSVDALRQARAQGVSAATLRARGCSAAALRAAGYTPAELKAAGFSDDDLRNAGFSPAEIAAANALLRGQCTPEALRQAKAQGATVAQLKARGCTDDELLKAGFTPAEIAAAEGAPTGIAGKAVVPPVGASEMQLAQLQAQQEAQLTAQQRQDKQTQIQTTMSAQASALFSTWSPPTAQQFVAGEPPKEDGSDKDKKSTTTTTTATTSHTAVAAAPVLAAPGGAAAAAVKCADIRAGDITFGVLTSYVNSDENSPVMATIVSGKLRGAKLIGQFTLLKEKVIITFTKLNLPYLPQSIGINAVAVDPDTAHTALADCVDKHYLLRYGTLFASSFLSGLADAISQSGSQTSTGSGGILVTHDKLNTGEKVAVALGAVGTQYASVLGSNFTRPPTVVVDAGRSIGVLFMQDLTLPEPCPTADSELLSDGIIRGCVTSLTH